MGRPPAPRRTARRPMNVCFQYDFHALGPGLFASGCLYQANPRQPRFIWVYDCGCMPTVPPMDWTAKMNQLALFTRGKERIDLLTLSHFDNDHITGVTALLARFQVNTLDRKSTRLNSSHLGIS